jgi:hypothetical protein
VSGIFSPVAFYSDIHFGCWEVLAMRKSDKVLERSTKRVGPAGGIGFASLFFIAVVFGLSGCLLAPQAFAETHTSGVPTLNSNPGAAYTLYLDFTGFNFSGDWGFSGKTPGNTPAYGNASATGSFNTAQQNDIREIWARTAQCYTPFNINVTTIDPAVAAGQAATDAARQAYYDSTARVMHTVIGDEQNNWYGDAGGVSYINVAENSYIPSIWNGYKTNWIFTNHLNSLQSRGQASAHENGHALSLSHMSDYRGTTKVNEYSKGDSSDLLPNVYGTNAPIMGNSYYSQRGEWRLDSTQNDVIDLLSNSGIGGYVNDGIGHSLATATPLPLNGTSINYAVAKGIITPTSTSNPQPIGESNYMSDYFLFRTNGGQITLKVNDGTEFLNPGTADPGAMLRSSLTILNSSGTVVGTGSESLSTLSTTYSGTLPAGNYYAKIASHGGDTQQVSDFNTVWYYEMGSFFLTGSGFTALVPEPGTCVMLLTVVFVGIGVFRRTRR